MENALETCLGKPGGAELLLEERGLIIMDLKDSGLPRMGNGCAAVSYVGIAAAGAAVGTKLLADTVERAIMRHRIRKTENEITELEERLRINGRMRIKDERHDG